MIRQPNRQIRWQMVMLLSTVAAVVLLLLTKPAHASTTFTVNSTGNEPDAEVSNDSPNVCDVSLPTAGSQCTLRAAIEEANDTPGADQIHFEIPGEGVKTIEPVSSPLPTITEAVTIDGYTQSGASPNTLARGTNAKIMIQLKGSDTGLFGLGIQADDTIVRGLAINGFLGNGVGVSGTSLNSGSTGVRIEGNFIGTDPSGIQDIGNGLNGVAIFGSGATVGGSTPGARNIISANANHGVSAMDSSGVKVLGNLIGTKKDAKGFLGNDGAGVAISGGVKTTVGGATPASANTIAFNGSDGVEIKESAAKGNRILSNSIFSNADLGLDLAGDGATPNDGAGDADVGPDGLQNSPLITRATTSSSSAKTTIRGRLTSVPGKRFMVCFFSNPSGTDEGKLLVGKKRVTTNLDGKVSFTFVPSKRVGAGNAITTTATGSEGTSEFSAPKTVVATK